MPGAPLLVFQDTSVLINFYRPGLFKVLGDLFERKVRWTGSVRRECERKEQQLSLPGLTAAADHLLGEPIVPAEDEHGAIRQLRTMMASPGDHPNQHLGEAETITIIQKRQLHSLIAIDDEEAGKWADPVPCVGTWRLIKLAHRRGDASPDEASRLWQKFVDAGGHLPYKIRTLPQFQTWIDADWSGP